VTALCLVALRAVVVRSLLTPFRCVGGGAASVMKAEPTILCNHDGAHGRMVRMAYVSFILYGVGIPASFAFLMWRYRAEIVADQRLREQGKGDYALTNPNISTRRCVLVIGPSTKAVLSVVDAFNLKLMVLVQAVQEAVRRLSSGLHVLEACTSCTQVRDCGCRNDIGPQSAVPGVLPVLLG
jgi:hypothetical protein